LIPQIGDFLENGYSQEEMKLQNEGRKIFHAPDLKVSCTTVRVPVMRSHSISVNLFCEKKPDLGAVRDAIEQAKGLVLCDSPSEKIYPMPLLSSDGDDVFVGRIRRDLISDKGLSLFCCGDQLRKGAATNAIEIAEIAASIR
ncbi:MAG: Asd/ArgC dimerization domain-containing protein, partial [Oscillospiraceae bacterium]